MSAQVAQPRGIFAMPAQTLHPVLRRDCAGRLSPCRRRFGSGHYEMAADTCGGWACKRHLPGTSAVAFCTCEPRQRRCSVGVRAQRRQAANVLSGEWPATEHIGAWRTTAGHLGHDVGLGDCSLRICTVVYRPPRSQLLDCLGVYSRRGPGERRGLVRYDPGGGLPRLGCQTRRAIM